MGLFKTYSEKEVKRVRPIVEKIKETKTPNDEYVYPPDESYVPTSATL